MLDQDDDDQILSTRKDVSDGEIHDPTLPAQVVFASLRAHDLPRDWIAQFDSEIWKQEAPGIQRIARQEILDGVPGPARP
jgi:hypothetical protein